jgi:hypothetical protein
MKRFQLIGLFALSLLPAQGAWWWVAEWHVDGYNGQFGQTVYEYVLNT